MLNKLLNKKHWLILTHQPLNQEQPEFQVFQPLKFIKKMAQMLLLNSVYQLSKLQKINSVKLTLQERKLLPSQPLGIQDTVTTNGTQLDKENCKETHHSYSMDHMITIAPPRLLVKPNKFMNLLMEVPSQWLILEMEAINYEQYRENYLK